MTAGSDLISLARTGDELVVSGRGHWDIAAAARLDVALARVPGGPGRTLIDLLAVERLDTAGAWLAHRTATRLAAAGAQVSFAAQPDHQVLLDQVAACQGPAGLTLDKRRGVGRIAERVGRATVRLGEKAVNLLGFYGYLITVLVRIARQPRRLRLTAVVAHVESTGFSALPIVGLLSFLIGVVLAYQGADQLRRVGADVFVVNLLAISILREIGVLMTSIVVAGRSGSAFTAQIGAMKVNQEIDAMRALGLDPMEVLVAPRVLALMISLPLLTFYANIMGLLGGAVMVWVVMDISPDAFVARLHEAANFWTVAVGLMKAPVFAFTIAMVGCYEGLHVGGSAESVGRLTTRAVVEGIFLVIVLDAIFSIAFSLIGI